MLVASTHNSLKSKKQNSIQIDTFQGVNVLLSVTRLKKEEAREAQNMMLIEDGVWDKRWGTKTLITMSANIDGFVEYIKSDLTRVQIIVAGGTIYKSTDLSSTNALSMSGITLTAGKKCYFAQIGSYLWITNGYDPIIRFDGTSLAQYTGLSAMGTVTPSRGAGLSSGSINVYYKVTAINAVGETAPCTEATITVDHDRDLWTTLTNGYVDLNWTAITGAIKYNIYYGDTSGYETLLDQATTNTYRDDGSLSPNPYIAPPTADSTVGPKLGQTWISNNRLWGVDPNNPYRIWYSGTGVFIGNFTSGYGGGWIEIEKGGRATTTAGVDFQDKSHVVFQTPDGRGTLWALEFQTINITSDQSITIPVPSKIIGQTGGNAPRSLLPVENDIMWANKLGIEVAGNEPQFFNVIRANEVSTKLRPYFIALAQDSINLICAYYFQGKVFFAVPTASGDPNQIVVYDRERLQWYEPWTIGVSQFGQFTTTDNTTHFLGCNGHKLIEFSSAYGDDDGVAFTWRYTSPQIPIDKNWTQFGKIKKAYIRLRNLSGNISFSFFGTRKTKSFGTLAAATITQGSSDTGIGWDPIGSVAMGSTVGKPTTFAVESLIKFIKVNKLLRDFQFQLQGISSADRATITGLMIKGFLISAGDPSSWKLSASQS